MSPEDRDRDLGVLAERIRRLEEDQQAARVALDRFSTRVDQQFESLRALISASVTGLKYVDEKSYERDRAAFVEALKEVRTSAEDGVKEAKAEAERGVKIAWGIAVALAIPFIGYIATAIMQASS